MSEKPTYRQLEQRIEELERTELKNKRSEKALRDSYDQYRKIVDNSPWLTCRFLPGGEITFANKAYCEYFGKTIEQLVGSNFLSLIPEIHRDTVMANISGLKVGSPAQSHEHPVMVNGNIKCHLWTNQVLFDAQGKVAWYQSTGEDITRRKQAEKKLRERVKELSGIYTLSQLIEEKVDDQPAVFQGTVDLIPDSWQYPYITCAKLVLDGKSYTTQNYENTDWTLSTDLVVDYHTRGTLDVGYLEKRPQMDEGPFLKEERALLTVIASRLQYFIKRRQTSAKLIENEYYLKKAQSIARLGHWKLDIVTGEINGSDEAFNIFGLSRKNTMLDDFMQVVHPDDREGHISHLRRGIELGMDWQKDCRLICPDGTEKLIHCIGIAETDKTGKTTALIGITQDITEQARINNAMLESKKKLKLEAEELEEVNMALNVILKKREQDKKGLEEDILSNLKTLVEPNIFKLKKMGLSQKQKTVLDILEINLNEIVSPFTRKIASGYLKFSPSEIEVANLVKNGKTNKEIAEILGVAGRTIEFHRENIRKKLNLTNKKTNLRTYLLSLV